MTQVGDRLSYNGELCTVRFVGSLPAWPSQTALGVEWDSGNGKHSGTHDGIRYFSTRRPGSGSFLKATKKHDGTRSVHEALVYAYGTEVAIEEITIGRKVMEIYGFEKLQRMQKDFKSLRDISLSRKCILGVTDREEEAMLRDSLSGLVRLDLSFNLFSTMDDVVKVVGNLNLHSLNLTGNRFVRKSTIMETNSLQSLNLTMTYPSEELLSTLPRIFTELTELSLCDNELTNIPSSILQFTKLRSLDLSMNEMTSIPPLLSQSTIISLNLADNDITVTPTHSTFPNITTLDLKRNNLADWSEIDHLVSQFPSVTEFRMTDNPIFEGRTLEEVEFQVIARWPALTRLNGVKIGENDRQNAELWFLSKMDAGELKYSSEKSEVLRNKYGRREVAIVADSNFIELKFKAGEKVIELRVLQSVEVLRLKSMLSRLFKRPFLQFEVTYQLGRFKEFLNNETAQVSSYGFTQGQVLTIESK